MTPLVSSPSIAVLYQDEWLLAVDKPHGLLSVPGRRADPSDCVLGQLQQQGLRPLVVHRLDRDTSGVMLFAQDHISQSTLSRMFAQRKIVKRYWAILNGRINGESGRIELPIRRDMSVSLPPRYIVDWENDRPAVTDWTVVERYHCTTRVELRPLTGRSHQLRVHCASIGHPILGDPIYSTTAAERMMLHAIELRFQHPILNSGMLIQSPAPVAATR